MYLTRAMMFIGSPILPRGRSDIPPRGAEETCAAFASLASMSPKPSVLVATGHYVRTWRDGAGAWHLGRGADPGKDQSYLLHVLGQAELARSLFPVGGQTKSETREHARRLGLPVAGKPDSQEVCFVPGADHAAFLAKHAPDLVGAGQVVDASGRILATHEGTFRFTIGQ